MLLAILTLVLISALAVLSIGYFLHRRITMDSEQRRANPPFEIFRIKKKSKRREPIVPQLPVSHLHAEPGLAHIPSNAREFRFRPRPLDEVVRHGA
jgi:hypothetical protein